MRTLHLLAAASLLAASGRVTLPVECTIPPPLCVSAAQADHVFFGEVVEETRYADVTRWGPLPPPEGVQAVKFKVVRPFKGVASEDVSNFYYYHVEARPFTKAARYLVFAQRLATGAFDHGCTLTRKMSKEDEDAWLRAGSQELTACFKAGD
jgi:hypothetical protein